MKNKPSKMIPVVSPSITAKEVRYVSAAAKDGWNENYRKYIDLFEKKFARYLGRRYALATSSCTAALHLAYLSLGIKKGDEVIVPNVTWIASVEPLYWLGAKPVFADIQAESWCIDPEDVERKISRNTKAILVVDLYGNLPDMKSINKIAKSHRLKVIEDAAEAIGSEYFNRKAGSFGDVSCFSFHGSKTLVAGEGGILVADDPKIIEKAAYYGDHCKDPKKVFWNLEIGYKYKMSNFQAACGLAQLERVDELVQRKRQIFGWYQKRLGNIEGIELNFERPGCKNSYWMVTVVFDKKLKVNKEKLLAAFAKENIQVRPFFYPLTQLPAINQKAATPVSFDISSRAINLPCGFNLKEKDVDYISEVLRNLVIK